MQLLLSSSMKPGDVQNSQTREQATLNSPSERALRYATVYRNSWRNRIIRFLGGYDPIAVGNLLYRANLLVNLQSYARYSDSVKPVVESQVKAIKMTTLKLDPVMGIIKGYARE